MQLNKEKERKDLNCDFDDREVHQPITGSAEDEEILALEAEINGHQKDLLLLNDKKKNTHLVVDQVQNWTNKVIYQIKNIYRGDYDATYDPHQNPLGTLGEDFEEIEALVCE